MGGRLADDHDDSEFDDRSGKDRRRSGLERKDQIMEKAKGLAALRIVLGAGFLQFGTAGTLPGSADGAIVNPTHDFWVSVATNAALVDAVNFLVVSGELLIGVALILGFATRFAGVMGALLMGFITIAAWDFGFGPINETVMYVTVALYVAYAEAGLAYGLDAIIEKSEIVAHRPALHYLLG